MTAADTTVDRAVPLAATGGTLYASAGCTTPLSAGTVVAGTRSAIFCLLPTDAVVVTAAYGADASTAASWP